MTSRICRDRTLTVHCARTKRHGGASAYGVRAARPCSPAVRAARWAAWLALGASLAAGDAGAHAPPLGARVLLGGADGDAVIVTNRGLVFRSSATGAGRLLCNEALLVTTSEIPKLAARADGGLLVGTSRGLRFTSDEGCTWLDVGGMQNANISALASDAADPRTAYVARYDGETPGVLVTHDEGASWSRLLVTGESEYVHSLLAPRAGYLHATMTSYDSQPPLHTLQTTSDGGRQWLPVSLPLSAAEYAAVVGAVDPGNPQRLALYTIANSPGLDPGRVLRSSDGGNSVELALELPEVRDVTYDRSGQLWVAARGGLYRSNPAGDFSRVSAASELGCVDFAGDDLLVCGHYAGVEPGAARPGVGISKDAGLTFQALIEFGRVDAPVACDGGSATAELCEQPWRDWQVEMLQPEPRADPYRAPVPLDTVATMAPVPDVAPPAPLAERGAAGGQGCALVSAERQRAMAPVLVLLVALGRWRRRAARV